MCKIVIVPVADWQPGKDCPTEYSAESDTIRVREDYDLTNDHCGWLVHEQAHHDGCELGMENWSEGYPDNEIEQFAYERQFRYLQDKGVTFNDILCSPIFASLRVCFMRHDILWHYWQESPRISASFF